MKKRRVWSWREGAVDRTNDHFELRYGSADDSGWNEWVPVARVGAPINGVFSVQFLINRAAKSQAQTVADLTRELDFYLVELGEENPWLYAQYHTATLADAYSTIHWSFFPKRSAKKAK